VFVTSRQKATINNSSIKPLRYFIIGRHHSQVVLFVSSKQASKQQQHFPKLPFSYISDLNASRSSGDNIFSLLMVLLTQRQVMTTKTSQTQRQTVPDG